ncbi:MAG: hypothetical protein AB7O26_06580, partial [Planctomycetaceae bacterium]
GVEQVLPIVVADLEAGIREIRGVPAKKTFGPQPASDARNPLLRRSFAPWPCLFPRGEHHD